MKTHEIEIQRIKAMGHAHGMIEMQVDAGVAASPSASRCGRSRAKTIRWI